MGVGIVVHIPPHPSLLIFADVCLQLALYLGKSSSYVVSTGILTGVFFVSTYAQLVEVTLGTMLFDLSK